MTDNKDTSEKLAKVVGVRYRQDEGLPKVVLKGSGYFADDILEASEKLKKKPLVIKNEQLLKQLYRLPVNAEIRPEMFEVVAAVLVHLYAVESTTQEKSNG